MLLQQTASRAYIIGYAEIVGLSTSLCLIFRQKHIEIRLSALHVRVTRNSFLFITPESKFWL